MSEGEMSDNVAVITFVLSIAVSIV